MLPLTYAFKTDTGRVRELNQDSLAVAAPDQLHGRADGLFVVADGMGGGAGGEVASKIAAETVSAAIAAGLAALETVTADTLAELLRDSLCAANSAVWDQAQRIRAQRGMGTTCVLALICNDALLVGNVGDSRCYLLRQGRLGQLSHDHAYLQAGSGGRDGGENGAGRVHFRHVMTRAIGFASMVEPEVERFGLADGDVLLLCSDGLSNLLEDAEIAEILSAGQTPETICDHLVAQANRNGGEDNITVIVARYGSLSPDIVSDIDTTRAEKLFASSRADKGEAHDNPDKKDKTGNAADQDTRPWWKRMWQK